MKVHYSSISLHGGRKENEDAIRIEHNDSRYLFALADGLGSYGNGRIASQTAVEACADCFQQTAGGFDFPEKAICLAQKKVLKKQKENKALSDMSTTLAVLYIEDRFAKWVHIGDSRVYLFQHGCLKDCTKDHSVPQLLVTLGEIRQNEVRGHPQQNRLLKVIGREWTSSPFSVSKDYELRGSEWFLLCSDGFWEYIDEAQMERCLKRSASPQQWLRKMDEIAQTRALGIQRDNYSAICVRAAR